MRYSATAGKYERTELIHHTQGIAVWFLWSFDVFLFAEFRLDFILRVERLSLRAAYLCWARSWRTRCAVMWRAIVRHARLASFFVHSVFSSAAGATLASVAAALFSVAIFSATTFASSRVSIAGPWFPLLP